MSTHFLGEGKTACDSPLVDESSGVTGIAILSTEQPTAAAARDVAMVARIGEFSSLIAQLALRKCPRN
jgi:hypothetical protein